MTKIEISARRDGHRRAGMRHTKAPVVHDASAFTAAQLAMLKADPELVVRELAPAPGKKDGGTKGSDTDDAAPPPAPAEAGPAKNKGGRKT